MPAFSLTPINSFPQTLGTEFPNPLEFAQDDALFVGPITLVNFVGGTVTEDGNGTLDVTLGQLIDWEQDYVPFAGPILTVNLIGGTVEEDNYGRLNITLTSDFTTGRRIEYAALGGNGTAVGGFGGPHQNNLGWGGASSVLGQDVADPTSVNFYDKLSSTTWTTVTTWGMIWGSNWSPFTFAAAPFSVSIIYRLFVLADSANNTWFFGFCDSPSYASGGSGVPESVFTNAFGFRIPKDADGDNILMITRVAGNSTPIDTGIPKPTTTEVFRFTVVADEDGDVTFSIETMNSDLSFTGVYTAVVAQSALTNDTYYPCFSGPLAATPTPNNHGMMISRGIYTI
jgi:hypothetical protein